MLLPANLQARHNITLYVCRRCTILYVLIFRGNGRVSLSRIPRLHAQRPCEIAHELVPRANTGVSARAALRACHCMHGDAATGKVAKVNVCACTSIYAPEEGTASEGAILPQRHYRRLNPVYTDGYPAEIRLGWRLAYDVGCNRKSWGWAARCKWGLGS